MHGRLAGAIAVPVALVLVGPTACAGTRVTSRGNVCRSSQLRAALGPPVSEATGQLTLIVRLQNTGRRCVLNGYPTIAFYDASGRIPFDLHDGGDQMITDRPPHRVTLRSRAIAIVMTNKYRCDLRAYRTASRLGLRVAGQRGGLAVSLARTTRGISWCGEGDPGSTVDVTPFEPSVDAARR